MMVAGGWWQVAGHPISSIPVMIVYTSVLNKTDTQIIGYHNLWLKMIQPGCGIVTFHIWGYQN